MEHNVAGIDHRRPHISSGCQNDHQKTFNFNFFKAKPLFIAAGRFDNETLDPIYGRSRNIHHFVALNQSGERKEKEKEKNKRVKRKIKEGN